VISNSQIPKFKATSSLSRRRISCSGCGTGLQRGVESGRIEEGIGNYVAH
jgi:hypothetical protein